MISTIIFDLNNTIVAFRFDDPEKLYNHALGVSKEKFYETAFKYWQGYEMGEYKQDMFLEKISTDLGLSRECISSMMHLLSNDVCMIDGMDKILENLFGRFRILLLAGDGEEMVSMKIRKFNLTRFFSAIYCTSSERMRKTSPQIYQILLAKEQLSAGTCLYIDDHPDFVRLAINAGMNGITFKNSAQLRKDLQTFSISLKG